MLMEGIRKYSADGTRLVLAESVNMIILEEANHGLFELSKMADWADAVSSCM